jgi:hypothetical protein
VRRLTAALAALALLAPSAAGAHGSIAPTAAPAGASQRFVVTVLPTIAGGPQMTGLTITAPMGVTIESAEANQPLWSASVSGSTITWQGGPLEGVGEEFAFLARTPDAEGTYDFVGQERYGEVVGPQFALAVTVTGLAATPLAPETDGDDGLAWLAVALAATALLLALGAVVAVAALWRRLPPRGDGADGVGELVDGGGALEPAPDHALAVDDEDPRL